MEEEVVLTVADVVSAFSTGLGTLSTNALSMLTTIVPIGIGIAGAVFLARKAMGWFKGIAK